MTAPSTPVTNEKSIKDTGWGPLPCPRCGEEATISVDLDDLAQFRCTGCDAEWRRPEIEAIIAAWGPVLRWLDLAPAKE